MKEKGPVPCPARKPIAQIDIEGRLDDAAEGARRGSADDHLPVVPEGAFSESAVPAAALISGGYP